MSTAQSVYHRSAWLTALLALAAMAAAHAQPGDTLGWRPRENAGSNVNTQYMEIMPVVSPDGQTLYFDRKYAPQNTGGTDDEDDIYYSALNPDGTWGPAVNAGPPLNTKGSDVLFWISPDGNTALVYQGDLADAGGLGLGISHRTGGKWAKPRPVTIRGLRSLGDGYYATITPDGKRMLLARAADTARPENLDIYCCTADGDDYTRWNQPVLLPVNSPGLDGAPFMAPDNRTLYFTSDRPGGQGAYDLYMTRRTDNTWKQWTTPVNLGLTANTFGYDAALTIPAGSKYAYISGDGGPGEGNLGKADIYRTILPDSLLPARVAIVGGTLTCQGKGLQGLIRVESGVTGLEVTSTASNSSGAFTLILNCGELYRVTGTAAGYTEAFKAADTRQRCDSGISLGLQIRRVSETGHGTTVPADITVYFDFGSDALTKDAQKALTRILPSVKAGSYRLDLAGHTDAIGEQEVNQTLSLRRAEKVKAWFTTHGLKEDAVTAFGKGTTLPVATNDTPAGRAQNRRVVVHLIPR